MILSEVFDGESEYTNKDEEIPTLNDMRKVKLTLGSINRIRMARDVRDFERKTQLDMIRLQFAIPQESGPGI